MRHRKKGRKFRRSFKQQKSLLYNLVSSLILKEKIITTEAKAKELRSFLERSITRAKKDVISNRRFLARYFRSEVVKKLFQELSPRYKDKLGGYSRIIKVGPRKGDGANLAVIELIK